MTHRGEDVTTKAAFNLTYNWLVLWGHTSPLTGPRRQEADLKFGISG